MKAVSSFQFPVSSNGAAGARYEKLLAWQKAMDLVQLCYALSQAFPADERFGLTAQLRRAAVSIPSNIAEGQGRLSKGEFKQFLGNARGSLFEAETQVYLASSMGLLSEKQREQFFELSAEVARLLNGLIASLK
ncbi:MAG: four helix bundle protein [Sinimarinibacterium flocculans]|uniref:four helix bundle protein n=1 Tax=Sinimarinibacterium flocculans TaxID=985250 RepID=UPI003C6A7128